LQINTLPTIRLAPQAAWIGTYKDETSL
jgi:hypothetical protein